jgi:hypothetical protein
MQVLIDKYKTFKLKTQPKSHVNTNTNSFSDSDSEK